VIVVPVNQRIDGNRCHQEASCHKRSDYIGGPCAPTSFLLHLQSALHERGQPHHDYTHKSKRRQSNRIFSYWCLRQKNENLDPGKLKNCHLDAWLNAFWRSWGNWTELCGPAAKTGFGHFRRFPKKQVVLMRKVAIWLECNGVPLVVPFSFPFICTLWTTLPSWIKSFPSIEPVFVFWSRAKRKWAVKSLNTLYWYKL